MELNKKNICRACLTEEGTFQSVFLVDNKSLTSLPIAKILSSCAAIQVTLGDKLPDHICSECAVMTVKTYNFKLKCERSDMILRARLKEITLNEQNLANAGQAKTTELLDESLIKVESEDDDTFIESFDENEINEIIPEENNEIEIHYEGFDLQQSGIKIEDLEFEYEDQPNFISLPLIKSEENLFSCPECEFSFDQKEYLDNHIINFHIKNESEVTCIDGFVTEQQPHICEVCFKGFDKISDLTNHMKTHSGKRSSASNKRSKSRNNKKRTNRKTTSSKDKPFECDICKTRFTFSGNLSRHKKNRPDKKTLECDSCDLKTSSSLCLAIHKRTHTGERTYKYDESKELLSDEENSESELLENHANEKLFECDVCYKKFSRADYLPIHKRSHTGEKPYKCDVCNNQFSRAEYLTVHQRTHTGEKPFQCDVCKKNFKRFENLTCHKRTHTGEKPFGCDMCDKKFATHSNMVGHKRVHHGDKPHHCDECERKFSRADYLAAHKRTHNRVKKFECDECDRKFVSPGYLRNHKKSHSIESL